MQVQIKSIFGTIIFEGDFSSIKEAVLAAVKSDANLRRADLSSADLSRADLRRANLSGVNLIGVNLSRADLRRADLRRADLRGADLRDADLRRSDLSSADLRDADLSGANLIGVNLSSADLSRANLRGANLRDADLSRADLRRANLRDADLSRANLKEIKSDFLAAIAKLPNEVPNLLAAIMAGKIDGSTYEGDCACLAGTIANHLECHYTELPEKGFAVDSDSPRERWFLGIKKGDTPENSQISAITLEWVDEFLSANNLVDSDK